jgi:anti-sigma-K factor RskA
VNIEDYIASGILEAYLMDQLSEQECLEVQAMAQKHAEVQAALAETEETMLAFTAKGSIAVPNKVKAKLFADLGLDIPSEAGEDGAAATSNAAMNKPAAAIRSMYPVWSAAASIIAIIGIVLSLYYRNQWLDSESRISQLTTENQTLAQQYNIVKNQSDQYAFNIDILRRPGLATVVMTGLDISPDALAQVHWNQKTNEVFLNAKKMPKNAAEKQYQLWAIVAGKPVNMGTFDVAGDMTSLLKMKSVENASAFAVTLEPRGGSVNPSMEQMYVIGNLAG